MQASNFSSTTLPTLPGLLSLPLKIIPETIHSKVLAVALNRIFSNELENNELEFLRDRSVAIEVCDLGLTYRLTLYKNKLKEDNTHNKNHLTVRGSLYDFISLVSQQEDPDTLVFQRRLIMEGDTELGLELKNYLDSIDIDSLELLRIIKSLSRKALPLYKQLST